MQNHLFQDITVKPPIRYFGGKFRAVKVLQGCIPQGVPDVVSPFFGSGAVELAIAARGTRVYGYDKYPPIMHFFKILQLAPGAVAAKIREIVRASRPETLYTEACAAYTRTEDDIRKAALTCIIYNTSFNGMGFNSGSRPDITIEDDNVIQVYEGSRPFTMNLIFYERIEEFYSPMLVVGDALDFRESLAKHPDMFAYCDPPYPDAGNIYGDADEYHKAFPHEELASILHQRNQWVLSYNDVPRVQALYPDSDYDWYRVQWHQGSRGLGKKKGNDVVIVPKGQPVSIADAYIRRDYDT